MNTAALLSAAPAAAAPVQAARPAAPRLDLYAPIHKAWRQYLADTMHRVGRLDVDDDGERQQVCGQVQALMQQMRQHLLHENRFMHTAIEARRPGGARRTSDDHVQHEEAIGNLDDEAQALRHARPEQRAMLAQRLYRHLALFVAHNLEHMHVEETELNATLWELYSDEELGALHGELVASIGPDEMARTTRWLASALSPQELAGMFIEMRANAPAAAFEALYDIALVNLDETRRLKLARALGLPPVPGLVI